MDWENVPPHLWGPRAQLTDQDYANAERFLPDNARNYVAGASVIPNWLEDETGFWYVRTGQFGKEFILVDIPSNRREPAFDHSKLASALTRKTGIPREGSNLPFDEITFSTDRSSISFSVDGQPWVCDLADYNLTSEENAVSPQKGDRSPDGRQILYSVDYDLYLQDVQSDQSTQLTGDGTVTQPYGTPLTSPLREAGIEEPDRWSRSVGLWSPGSRYVLSYRINRERAEVFHWLQNSPLDGTARPRLYTRDYPLPGEDSVPEATLVLIDAHTKQLQELTIDPISILYYGGPLRADRIWWSEDEQFVYILHQGRGHQTFVLWKVECATGSCHKLITEHDPFAATDLHPSLMGSPQIRILEQSNQIIWFSQRDGWGHLYLYELSSGKCQRQITRGEWSVLEIISIDESSETIYFSAIGMDPENDPYFPFLYECRLDGSDLKLLTPENAYHDVAPSPDGMTVVDTYSRVDLPPVSVLRARDGTVLCELERADISTLESMGWRPPERFSVMARDGITPVYGVLFLPTWLEINDPVTLPILDDIYAGPQTNRAPATFTGTSNKNPHSSSGYWHAQAIAELGFAVVMVDGLGMPFRSRRFHSHSFRNLQDGGLEEHVIAIQELGRKYPFLDTERVGIYGHSAGGYSSMNAMLRFPDFYKVAVSSAGNHDHRLDKASWIERYMGLPVGDHYKEQANASRVDNLKGKLLLIHGEMDENVHVASTMQLVDALIKANKDFDLLILPNRPHACVNDPYFIRRKWDYFVRHLLNAEPPQDYLIGELRG